MSLRFILEHINNDPRTTTGCPTITVNFINIYKLNFMLWLCPSIPALPDNVLDF